MEIGSKRKIKLSFLISLLLFPQLMEAQSNENSFISGVVCDSLTKEPLSYCTILIVKGTDSAFAYGAITDNGGKYKIENVMPGFYKMTYSYIGYNSEVVDISLPDKIGRDTVFLATSKKEIEEVTVTASVFERDIDVLIMNTSLIKLPEGSTVIDLIKEVPGAYITPDYQLNLLGKEIRVLIDGRPIYITFDKLRNMLNNQASDDIGKIEIMFSPPPKYIDEWDGPLLNIITKKKLASGLYGTLSNFSRYGKYPGDEFGLDLNFRTSKLNAFISYGPRFITRETSEKVTQTNISENHISSFSETKDKERNHGYYLTSGLGMELKKNSSIDLTYDGYSFKNTTVIDDSTTFFFYVALPDTATISSNRITECSSNHEINLFYKNKFKDESQYFTVEGDYSITNINTYEDRNYYYFESGNLTPFLFENNRDNTLFKSKILFFRLDNSLKISKFRIEDGLKYSFAKTDNDFIYEYKTDDLWINDPTKSDFFSYKESILSGYISAGEQLTAKFGYLLSIRGSYTWQNGHSRTLDLNHKKNYIRLLPSLFMSYKINDNNEITLNYDCTIKRPSFETLNPFTNYDSPALFTQGNPDLVPGIRNEIMIMDRYKSLLFLKFSYNKNINDIALRPVLNETEDKVIGYKYDNFGSSESFNLSSTYSQRLFKNRLRLRLIPSITYSISDDKGSGFHKEAFYYGVYINGAYTLSEKSKWILSLYNSYYSGLSYGYLESGKANKCGLSVSRSFFHNNLDCSFDVNDIFNSGDKNFNYAIGNVNYKRENNPDSRFFRIRLSYSFSKKYLEKYERHEIDNEEKGRIE